MNGLSLMFGVIVMFFLRIGLPVLVLIVLGVLVDRWQSQRDGQENDSKPLKDS